ncbi:MBL fold metallo-hydrolase [Clostridium sediminicola]|uniref:MBL fold metallo-hydrolase n=1 Tax=Clostridium sediminicola TaxID=3114879 RepID=UPI0031F219B5
MKWKDNTPREYYSKYEKMDIKNNQGWFDVYRLLGNVFAICEPQHFQEVNAYLIIGEEKALLFDTGMGICNIRLVVEELYQGEIIVVNSHFHFDHIGDNYRFDVVHVFDDDFAREMSSTGLSKEGMGNQLDEDMFLFDYPNGFKPHQFRIPPYNIELMQDGDIFELGNRTIKVVHTPGHSNDSIMLYDDLNKILFTGDTFYLGALYAHFNCQEFGKSNVLDYRNTMKELLVKFPDVKALYCSHNDFIVDPVKLFETEAALSSIMLNSMNETVETKSAHSYLENESELKECNFKGFSIVFKVINTI